VIKKDMQSFISRFRKPAQAAESSTIAESDKKPKERVLPKGVRAIQLGDDDTDDDLEIVSVEKTEISNPS
jgi:hypothetical protein